MCHQGADGWMILTRNNGSYSQRFLLLELLFDVVRLDKNNNKKNGSELKIFAREGLLIEIKL